MSDSDNPFDRFGIDPKLGPRAITERFRDLIETASEEDRALIRAAWEELTLHPARRLRAALLACPETRSPVGSPPPRARRDVPVDPCLTVEDLAFTPSVAAALGGDGLLREGISEKATLEDDPILARATDVR